MDKQAALREVLRCVLLMEARTYRHQAKAIIDDAIEYVLDAADTLQRSRFSSTAIVTFRGRVSGALMRAAPKVSQLGWWAGGGEGDPPKEIHKTYLDAQQNYLSRWIWEIGTKLSMPGGAHRARMYAQSLETVYQRAYNRAKSEGAGLPELPAYPRDGSTQCRTNCNCYWEGPIKKADDEYWVYWRLRPGESCDDCLRRAVVWKPLKIVNVNGVWTFEESR